MLRKPKLLAQETVLLVLVIPPRPRLLYRSSSRKMSLNLKLIFKIYITIPEFNDISWQQRPLMSPKIKDIYWNLFFIHLAIGTFIRIFNCLKRVWKVLMRLIL